MDIIYLQHEQTHFPFLQFKPNVSQQLQSLEDIEEEFSLTLQTHHSTLLPQVYLKLSFLFFSFLLLPFLSLAFLLLFEIN